MRSGAFSARVTEGAIGAVTCGGVEVLRGLTCPVRNADWGTYLTETVSEQLDTARYARRFTDSDKTFDGALDVKLDEVSPGAGRLVAEVSFTFRRAARVNRVGFTLLHPLRGVVGQPLTLRHPGGGISEAAFPSRVSPAQPALDIAGLAHVVQGVAVEIAMEGEVFEMEDQRNWSDASFKTYCRPLSLPFPYGVAAGETVRQRIVLTVRQTGEETGRKPDAPAAPRSVRMPQVMLAHESGLSDRAALAAFPGVPVLLRLTPDTPQAELESLAARPGTALEIVFEDLPGLQSLIARARMAGLMPLRVTALPRLWLKSHQPSGPWPEGPRPEAALPLLRAGFPGRPVGGGSLTNFTELNRARPDPETVDFVTFGNTALVHAADDLSVWQTLEALPDIFRTAQDIAGGKPLHLGLLSIGMRSNPYGDGVAANPQRLRLPMAQDDPRQGTGFAAAYAVAVLAGAAVAGVESLALAMPDGPLGATGPLADVVRTAAALAGQEVQIARTGGVVVVDAGGSGLAANCTGSVANVDGLPPLIPESATIWDAPAPERQDTA
ncbi:hypothetical protein SAMN05660710_02215 [Paracoccus tibetensis]|uniref:Uncharacterized protein n=1 Tax=Paracoccus tibetensis TaxID=336292 RepID=A0A1G5HP26_9RHOB|nr:hypothetical protein SAMN05660710_02215 [Paracoccus tibetensis]